MPTETSEAAGHTIPIGGLAGYTDSRGMRQVTGLLTSNVVAVRADGRRVAVLNRAQLPYGLRLVQIDFKQPPFGAPTPPLMAIGLHGEPLAYLTEQGGGPGSGTDIRWWERPQAVAAGPCRLGAQGLPALRPEWGHVATTIKPYPLTIIGRAFFSCIDTEYYLHNWPLDAAILLDAQRPGSSPASLPGMKPIPQLRGVVSAPGDWHGEITAVRRRNAWLIVAGGSGSAQRLEVLRHITATVSMH